MKLCSTVNSDIPCKPKKSAYVQYMNVQICIGEMSSWMPISLHDPIFCSVITSND